MRIRILAALVFISNISPYAIAEDKTAPVNPDAAVDRTPPKGRDEQGSLRLITGQLTHSAGVQHEFTSRASDFAVSPDGYWICVKTKGGCIVLDAADPSKTAGSLNYPDGKSGWHGISASPIGDKFFVSTQKNLVWELSRGADGKWSFSRSAPTMSKGAVDGMPLGLALHPEGSRLYACLSSGNSLIEVDLTGKPSREISTGGVCPYEVILTPDGTTAWISNYGGHLPTNKDKTMRSNKNIVVVNAKGHSISGTVTCIDLATGKVGAEIEVGLHPAGMTADWKKNLIYVANANSDSVSVIDVATKKCTATWSVRPDSKLPFGSLPTSLVLSQDGQTLFVTNSGNNALCVLDTGTGAIRGFIPTGRFPSSVKVLGNNILVLNLMGADGVGRGSLSQIAIPDSATLAGYTRQVLELAHTPQVLADMSQAQNGIKPKPIPARYGEPSVFKHVIYVIKENRTYDQVLGDLDRGNRDPKLCQYGREITPNQHAIAEQFVLLDNYYCNGIVSADGHQWATQGITSDYQEKDSGVWSRSYDFGTDSLCFAGCDFLWDAALLSGHSFRNYGEFDFPELKAKASWFDSYNTWKAGKKIEYTSKLEPSALRDYSCLDYPGWNLLIPDGYRADVFLKELEQFSAKDSMPNLILLYLPQDHTSGSKKATPTPRAYVAENDLALGRIIDGISHTKFWKDSVIFVNEDDPQDGTDHVDGHRSFCLVASPYAKHGETVSRFYNQTSVIHTICRILGLPPMNQTVAQAPAMEDCFNETPDLTAYTVVQNRIAIDEPNQKLNLLLNPEQARWCLETTSRMDFEKPDEVDDDKFNRVLWMCSFPDREYPGQFAGSHGRGLKPLGLAHEGSPDNDNDDDGDKPEKR